MALTERTIFWRSLFSSVLLIVSLITSAVTWGHWAYTLDTCPSRNCGCVLFGIAYDQAFAGGPVEFCQYITYSQIPVFITSVVFLFYFGYRTFIKARRQQPTAKAKSLLYARQQNARNQVDTPIEPPSLGIRITILVLSLIMELFLISSFVIATWGFFASCKELRTVFIRDLRLSGNSAEVVEGRLACTAIFDFLDYLQPDRIGYDFEPLKNARQDRINTGVALMIGKTALCMNSVNWIYMNVFHIKRIFCRSNQLSYQS